MQKKQPLIEPINQVTMLKFVSISCYPGLSQHMIDICSNPAYKNMDYPQLARLMCRIRGDISMKFELELLHLFLVPQKTRLTDFTPPPSNRKTQRETQS